MKKKLGEGYSSEARRMTNKQKLYSFCLLPSANFSSRIPREQAERDPAGMEVPIKRGN